MRKVFVVALGVLAAGLMAMPVQAAVTELPVSILQNGNVVQSAVRPMAQNGLRGGLYGPGIGVFDSTAGGAPYGGFTTAAVQDSYALSGAVSNNIVLTFAFHWPYGGNPVNGQRIHFSFLYDITEVTVVGLRGTGAFPTEFNFNSASAATLFQNFNGTPGTHTGSPITGVNSLQVARPVTGVSTTTLGGTVITGLSPLTIAGSSAFPFMQVTLHPHGINADSALDAFIGNANLIFTDPFGTQPGVLFNTGGGIIGFTVGPTTVTTSLGGTVVITNTPVPAGASDGVDVVPEPGSLALLGFGLVGIGTGAWRRRRR